MAAWGWALLASGAVALALFAYRFFWRERYRFPFGMAPGSVRLRGKVTGPPGTVLYCTGEDGEEILATPFVLECENGTRVPVLPSGAVLTTRSVSHRLMGQLRTVTVGDHVTIDGTPTTVQRRENLYRDAGRVPAVEAIRIAGGNWPELRWLRFPAAVGVLVFFLSLLQVLFAPGQAPPGVSPGDHDVGEPATLASQGYATFYVTSHADPSGLEVLLGTQVGEPLSKEPTSLEALGDLYGARPPGALIFQPY